MIKIIENSLLVIMIIMFLMAMYIILKPMMIRKKEKHDYDWDNIQEGQYANTKTFTVTCKKCGNTCFSWSLESLKEYAEFNIKNCTVKDKSKSKANKVINKLKQINPSTESKAFIVTLIFLLFNVYILREIEPISIFYVILYFLLVTLFTLEKIRKELKALCQIKR